MASYTICPRCTSHLEWPVGAQAAAQVQCPVCEVEFSLATVAQRELPLARLVTAAESSAIEPIEPIEDDSPRARLARLLQSSADLREVSSAAPPEPAAAAPVAVAFDEPIGATSRLDAWIADLARHDAGAEGGAGAGTARLAEDAEEYDCEVGEEPVVPRLEDAAVEAEIPALLQTVERRPRRPAGVRTLIGAVGGGAIGLLLGAYGLLWLRGAEGDVAGLSRWLPASLLPADMRAEGEVEGDEGAEASSAPATSVAGAESARPLQPIEPPALPEAPLHRDAAVMPAAAVEPIAEAPAGTQRTSSPPGVSTLLSELQGVRRYAADEFASALTAADAALGTLLAGDLARQESWSSMGPAYVALAALAERYALPADGAAGEPTAADTQAAEAVFQTAASDGARRADLGTIASRWLQHERRQNLGVFVVGTVRASRHGEHLTELTLDVPLGDGTVVCQLATTESRLEPGDEVAAVGVILDRPREQLPSYDGEAAQLVVAAWLFVPDKQAAPAGALPLDAAAAPSE